MARLRKEDHEVIYVAELHSGVSDQEVLRLAEAERALLLTSDKDFGDITYLQQHSKVGIVLLRLHALSSEQKASIVVRLLREHEEELLGAFTVLRASSVRIRYQYGGRKRDA
ncbi:MAG: DUF5615 family PIN-like protein [Chloroflexota bacterium]|nr:DUF5615 family PIN-like protein [Chloroflexota bacterium]